MSRYSPTIQKLIDTLAKMPGLGLKSAERLVFHLLYQPAEPLHALAQQLDALKKNVSQCQTCFNFGEGNPCEICRDSRRNHGVICVVSRPQDLAAIEKISDYQGVYHVLGGVIDPLEGLTPEQLKIKELFNRLKANSVHEVILALSLDMPGETTLLYLAKLLKEFPKLKITRLARGLPIGSDLEYADEVTLSNALKGRRDI